MLDPLTYLSFSMYENRNVYALLVGSGVSRAAHIPTGWEITLDLIRRVARSEGVKRQTDWAAWYRGKYGKEPSYSDLLDNLATTPDERRSILHRYIEPTPEEIEEHKKIPTAAHHAIARMVRDGFVRVIMTTNFDRLIESALREAGVEPTVIASDDALKGAVPLIHSRCHVIKLHGDYLDTRIKNTEAELSGYSKPMNGLLDRVLDEHGLIVCGWSGEWDHALCKAIMKAPNRRYPFYWASRSEPSESAQRIINHRAGRTITIESADTFFSQLAEKLSVQAEVMRPDPRSVELLISSAKRYLSGPHHRIQLADLLGDELRRTREQLEGQGFGAHDSFTNDEFRRRVDRYEAIAEPIVRLLSVSGRWGDDNEIGVASDVLRDLCKPNSREGLTVWINLSVYPAVLTLHAYGLGALHAGRYKTLFNWLTTDIPTRRGDERIATQRLFLSAWEGGENKLWQRYPEMDKRKTALSDHIFGFFNRFARDYGISDGEFEYRFELYELLASLTYLSINFASEDLEQAQQAKAMPNFVWVPMGRIGWHSENGERALVELSREDMRDRLLKAGFAHGSAEFYDLSLENFRRIMSHMAWW